MAGCTFVRTNLLDPWLWFALVTGASCVVFAQIQCAILQPESRPRPSWIVSTLTQPSDIGESSFWGEVGWLALGAVAMSAHWLLDTLC